MDDTKILGVSATEPSKILKVQIQSETEIKDFNKNGRPVTVSLKRGYDTVLDVDNGVLYDPKHMG